MSAMLLKDFYILKSTGKSYLGLIALFTGLAVAGIYDVSFVSAVFVMLLVMMPATAFAYDEQAGWNKYAVATPAGRAGVVRGKYLFSLLLLVGALLLNLTLYFGIAILRPDGSMLRENISVCIMVISTGLAMVDVLLPLIFRFGSQKSRVMLMIVVGVLVALGVAAKTIVGDVSGSVGLLVIVFPVVALGGFVISYFTSLSIFEKKEL